MSARMIKVKAVAVGALTVILAMLVVVVLAVPLDRFVASQLAGGTVSVENLFLLTYWPIRIFTWIGLFLAIALGSYVATGVSRSGSNIHWLIMVTAQVGTIWEPISGLRIPTCPALSFRQLSLLRPAHSVTELRCGGCRQPARCCAANPSGIVFPAKYSDLPEGCRFLAILESLAIRISTYAVYTN